MNEVVLDLQAAMQELDGIEAESIGWRLLGTWPTCTSMTRMRW